jgi:nitroreductase
METNKIILQRYSPIVFTNKDILDADLQIFLEASRWAPSAFNEQPWRLLLAPKWDKVRYEKLFGCLFDGNKAWAGSAPVLMLVCARRNFSHNNKPNNYHQFDTGMAMQNFIISAMESGVYVHQMAGFDHELAAKNFEISDEYSIISLAAIGYPGDINQLPEELLKRAQRPRVRKPISEIIF